MTTLNDFIASIATDGLAFNNRFSVMFSLPPTLIAAKSGYNWTGHLPTVLMYCDSVTLPGLNISTTQARTYGELREMPYERLYDNINLTFYVDNSMDSKSLFDTWINSIQDPATRQFNYYNEYITDMEIFVHDKDDEEIYRVKLFECYPKSISPIQMDYSSKDVMKLQVSINYRYWLAGSAISDANNGLIINGREILDSDGAQPNDSQYDDNIDRPNFNVENTRLYPKF
jgi:hypothetical protein